MVERRLGSMTALLAVLALPACKPPPTDAAMARAANLPAPVGPSAPITSPETEGALWAESAQPMRLVYGLPGEPVLLALECIDAGQPGARLKITRHAPADEGAGALLALIGNGHIGRLPVDATEAGARMVWEGETPAIHRGWNALDGAREVTATVPGAGLVRLNPSSLPGQLIEACRGLPAPDQPADRG